MAIENLTALITGGCGQIGLAITEYLQSHHPSTKIHILDISTPIKPSPGIIYHIGNITDASAISSQFSLVKPEIVFHTAGLIPSIAARLGMDKEKDFMNINLEGTRIILEEAKEAGVKAFVYTSSADIMKGNSWQDLRGVDEEMPIPEVFDNPYGKLKALAESLVLSASSPTFPTTALRAHAVFSAKDTNLFPLILSSRIRRSQRNTSGARRMPYQLCTQAPSTLRPLPSSAIRSLDCAVKLPGLGGFV